MSSCTVNMIKLQKSIWKCVMFQRLSKRVQTEMSNSGFCHISGHVFSKRYHKGAYCLFCFSKGSESQLVSDSVSLYIYMDNTEDPAENQEKCTGLYKHLSFKASLFARNNCFNSDTVISEIPQADRAQEVDLSKGQFPAVKILGLWWNAETDSFMFCSKSIDSSIYFTNCLFLSKVFTLYDPLSFIFHICYEDKDDVS